MLQFEKYILTAYEQIGLTPRDNQVEIANEILTKFIVEECNNVIASLPTGSGKTILTVVIASALKSYLGLKDNQASISMHTNILMDQYKKTFGHLKDFCFVKGVDNYQCDYYSNLGKYPVSALACTLTCEKEDKYKCAYHQILNRYETSPFVVTNFSKWIVDKKQKKISPLISIFDEAQNLNNSYAEVNCIKVNKETFELINFLDKKYNLLIDKTFELFINDVCEDNYYSYTKELQEKVDYIYFRTSRYIDQISVELKYLSKLKKSLEKAKKEKSKKNKELKEARKQYKELCGKIKEFSYTIKAIKSMDNLSRDISLVLNGDAIFGKLEYGYYVKPAIIGEGWGKLDPSKYNLFISGTISQQYIEQTMSLIGKTAFIKQRTRFPIENKRVIVFKPLFLNYKTMQEEKTIKELNERCLEIIKAQSRYKGIISTPSFALTHIISEFLYENEIIVYEHRSGEKLENLIDKFKNFDHPSVLVSPMLFEGIDLPDDLTRFQIITKCPYASLADNVVKHIISHYPDLYQYQTLIKIIQFFGRGVRSATDWSNIFVLDCNIERLLTSKMNVWSDEYKLIESKR